MGRRKVRVEPELIAPNLDETRPDLSGSSVEKRLIAKAYAEAERRIDDGTASSEMICLFLKAGSSKQYIDQQKTEAELDLARTKIELMKAQQKTEEMFVEAMSAFRSYQGDDDGNTDL